MRGSKRRAGLRRGRSALLVAIAATAVTAFAASSAQATTTNVDMTFDHGLLKLGGSDTPIDIVGDSPPQPVLHADVCTDATGGCAAAGDFTVTTANFDFPPFTSDVSGIPGETATVDLIPLANVTGHYDFAAGTLTTNASNYESTVGLAGPLAAHCLVSPINIAFSTAKTTPFQGDAFDSLGALGPPVNGVIDADWATLPTPGDDPAVPPDDSSTCSSVLSVFTTGPGGIGLGNGIEPVLNTTTPPPSGGGGSVTPPPTTNTAGLKKCLKKAKKIKPASKRKKAIKKCKKKFA